MNTYENLVHYICEKTTENPVQLGATKLNKILWFSDLFAYIESGKSISGETYIKRQYGPVPKNILSVINSLQTSKKIAVRSEPCHGYLQKQFISLKECTASALTDKQKELIEDVIRTVCENHKATSISELTHNDIWEMAAEGEEIPLYSIFSFRPGEINQNDISWAKNKIEK